MFEREFEGVPSEARRKLEPMIESAVRELRLVLQDPSNLPNRSVLLVSCAAKIDSVMILLSAFRRDTQK